MSVVDALKSFDPHGDLSALDAMTSPPVDAFDRGAPADEWFNRQLAMIFTGLVVLGARSAQIAFLLSTIDAQTEALENYRSLRRTMPAGLQQARIVSVQRWHAMISVLLRWAADLHQDACGGDPRRAG